MVRSGYGGADEVNDDRRFLLTKGMRTYTRSGVVGRPSLASSIKGAALLDALSRQFEDYRGLLDI